MTEKKEPATPLLKLTEIIGYFFAKGDDYKESTKPVNYVVGANGSYSVRNTPLGTFVKKLTTIPKLDDLKEGVYLTVPKIPFEFFNQMVTFMKTIYDKDKTESTIMLFHDEENGFQLWVPKQRNGGTASDYDRADDPEYVEMCELHQLVMVAHSHPWNGTTVSPSGIDDRDEKEPLLYMVVGNVCGIPNTYVSTCPGGERMKLNFFDIFENPLQRITEDPLISQLLNKFVPEKDVFETFVNNKDFAVPLEWIQKCASRTYSYASTGGYQGNAGREISGKSTNGKSEYGGASYCNAYYGGYYGYDYDGYNFDDDYVAPASSPKTAGFIQDKQSGILLPAGGSSVAGKGAKVITLKSIEKAEDATDKVLMREAEFEVLADAIDAALDLSEVNLAQLIFMLCDEGKESVIRHCLAEKDKEVAKHGDDFDTDTGELTKADVAPTEEVAGEAGEKLAN